MEGNTLETVARRGARRRVAAWVVFVLFLGIAAATPSPLAAADMSPATQQLFDAIQHNDLAAAQIAIANGARTDVPNKLGQLPVDLAVDKGRFEIAHYLLSLRNTGQTAREPAESTTPAAPPQAPEQSAETPPPAPMTSPPPAPVTPPPIVGTNPFDPQAIPKGAEHPVITGPGPGGPAASNIIEPPPMAPPEAPEIATQPAARPAPSAAKSSTTTQSAPAPAAEGPAPKPSLAKRLGSMFGLGSKPADTVSEPPPQAPAVAAPPPAPPGTPSLSSTKAAPKPTKTTESPVPPLPTLPPLPPAAETAEPSADEMAETPSSPPLPPAAEAAVPTVEEQAEPAIAETFEAPALPEVAKPQPAETAEAPALPETPPATKAETATPPEAPSAAAVPPSAPEPQPAQMDETPPPPPPSPSAAEPAEPTEEELAEPSVAETFEAPVLPEAAKQQPAETAEAPALPEAPPLPPVEAPPPPPSESSPMPKAPPATAIETPTSTPDLPQADEMADLPGVPEGLPEESTPPPLPNVASPNPPANPFAPESVAPGAEHPPIVGGTPIEPPAGTALESSGSIAEIPPSSETPATETPSTPSTQTASAPSAPAVSTAPGTAGPPAAEAPATGSATAAAPKAASSGSRLSKLVDNMDETVDTFFGGWFFRWMGRKIGLIDGEQAKPDTKESQVADAAEAGNAGRGEATPNSTQEQASAAPSEEPSVPVSGLSEIAPTGQDIAELLAETEPATPPSDAASGTTPPTPPAADATAGTTPETTASAEPAPSAAQLPPLVGLVLPPVDTPAGNVTKELADSLKAPEDTAVSVDQSATTPQVATAPPSASASSFSKPASPAPPAAAPSTSETPAPPATADDMLAELSDVPDAAASSSSKAAPSGTTPFAPDAVAPGSSHPVIGDKPLATPELPPPAETADIPTGNDIGAGEIADLPADAAQAPASTSEPAKAVEPAPDSLEGLLSTLESSDAPAKAPAKAAEPAPDSLEGMLSALETNDAPAKAPAKAAKKAAKPKAGGKTAPRTKADDLLDQLANFVEPTDGKAAKGKPSAGLAPIEESKDVGATQTAMVPPAVARQIPDTVLTLGESVHITEAMPEEPADPSEKNYCITKNGGATVFCVEPVDWPADLAQTLSVSSIIYQGAQAIVRYDDNTATRFHAIFPTDSYEAVVAYYTKRFGEPTETIKRTIAPFAQPRRANPVVMWRRLDPLTNEPTTLEIRRYDDARGGFPDLRFGAILLYNKSSPPIFPVLSTLDLMPTTGTN